jgi:hypothetical protein
MVLISPSYPSTQSSLSSKRPCVQASEFLTAVSFAPLFIVEILPVAISPLDGYLARISQCGLARCVPPTCYVANCSQKSRQHARSQESGTVDRRERCRNRHASATSGVVPYADLVRSRTSSSILSRIVCTIHKRGEEKSGQQSISDDDHTSLVWPNEVVEEDNGCHHRLDPRYQLDGTQEAR